MKDKLMGETIEIDQKYIDEAVRLATAYPNMLKQKQFQEELRAGKVLYTKDMAIEDLMGGGIDYSAEHVQSSNISNIPERIVIKLSEGYVEKKNAQMVREATMSDYQLAELDDEIHTVQTAMRHMDKFDRAVFDRFFFRGKSCRSIVEAANKKMYVSKVFRAKERAIEVLAKEVMIREFYRRMK